MLTATAALCATALGLMFTGLGRIRRTEAALTAEQAQQQVQVAVSRELRREIIAGMRSREAYQRIRAIDNVEDIFEDADMQCPQEEEEEEEGERKVGWGVHLAPLQRDHADNVERAEESLRAALPGLRQAALLNASKLATNQQRRNDSELQGLQPDINEAPMLHYGCPSLSSQPAPANLLRLHSVQYHSLTCSGHINVPICKCSACQRTFVLPAAVVGCVESSIISPNLWMDRSLMLFYHSLRHRSGVSVASFTGSLNDRFQLYQWQYPVGSNMASELDDRRVRDCYRHSRAELDPFDDVEEILNQYGASGFAHGVIGRCRICSDPSPLPHILSQDEIKQAECILHSSSSLVHPLLSSPTVRFPSPSPATLDHEVPSPSPPSPPSLSHLSQNFPTHLPDFMAMNPWNRAGRRPLFAMADGNMKLNHHAKCGQTISKVRGCLLLILDFTICTSLVCPPTQVFTKRKWNPLFGRYYGRINQNIELLLASRDGGLKSSDEVSCAAHISAARAHSSTTQVGDLILSCPKKCQKSCMSALYSINHLLVQ